MPLNRPTVSTVAVSALVVALVAASCSSGDEAPLVAPALTTEPATNSTGAPGEEANTATTDPAPDEAVDAWLTMWDGAELLITDPETASITIRSVATDRVVDQLNTLYNPATESGVESTPRTFDNNPILSIEDDGSVTINDCIFESPKVGNATIWYSGVAWISDDRWEIQAVTLESQIGCVPSQLAEAALGGYEHYWEARSTFWDPADPTNPLVTETMTGEHLTLVEGLLADHQERGLALRGRPETHPEIIEVRSASEAVVLDCKIQDPARGLFVAATGERLADIPEISEGQRDLSSAVMILEDGVWKVSDVQGQADVACDTAPTTQGLPIV